MLPAQGLDREFFARLEKIDLAIARAVGAAGCPALRGAPSPGQLPAQAPRGPGLGRGGGVHAAVLAVLWPARMPQASAATVGPGSWGRRVYLEVVVALAVAFAQAVTSLGRAVRASGVPRRTLQRWDSWWREILPRLPTWAALRARFVPPPPDEVELPLSLYERLSSDLGYLNRSRGHPGQPDVMVLLARCLAPVTTGSVPDGSRFVGALAAAPLITQRMPILCNARIP